MGTGRAADQIDREELAILIGGQSAWTAVVLAVALALWRTGLSTCFAACGVWRIRFTFVSHFPSRKAETWRGEDDAMGLQPAIFDTLADEDEGLIRTRSRPRCYTTSSIATRSTRRSRRSSQRWRTSSRTWRSQWAHS